MYFIIHSLTMAHYGGVDFTTHFCKPFSALICGNPSTGKRTFVYKFLENYRKLIGTSEKAALFYFAPPDRQRPSNEILSDFFEDQRYFPTTLEEAHRILNELKEIKWLPREELKKSKMKTVYVVDILTGDDTIDIAYVEWASRNLFRMYNRNSGNIVMFIARERHMYNLNLLILTCTNLILFDVAQRYFHLDNTLLIEPTRLLYDAWGYATRKKYGYLNVDFGDGALYYYYPKNRVKPKLYNGLFIEPGVLEFSAKMIFMPPNEDDWQKKIKSLEVMYPDDEYTGEKAHRIKPTGMPYKYLGRG